MGMSTPILNAAQEQRTSIEQQGGTRIKYAVDRVVPISGSENGVVSMAKEKVRVLVIHRV